MNFLQLTPLGAFRHTQGLQLVDDQAVANLVRNFNHWTTRLKNFIFGVPIYIGHPDVPELAAQFHDTKAYGWVKKLEDRGEAGLWAQVDWTPDGLKLVQDNAFKFVSPHWTADQTVLDGRKVFRPNSLLSVGLTNTPNLPVEPVSLLANIHRPSLNDPQFSSGPSMNDLPSTMNCLYLPRDQREKIEAALANATLAPCQIEEFALSLSNGQPFPLTQVLPTTSRTENLPTRSIQFTGAAIYMEKVRELQTKGFTYDEAWSHVQKFYPHLFS